MKSYKKKEENGLVKSIIQNSPTGPQRKVFGLTKSLSITLNVAPHLFKQNIVFFDPKPQESQISKIHESLMKRKNNIENFLITILRLIWEPEYYEEVK